MIEERKATVNEDRAREGVEHLQAAAVEVIGALRAFLDVVEGIVRDPGAAATLAGSLLDPTRGSGDAASDAAPSRVTRIRVS